MNRNCNVCTLYSKDAHTQAHKKAQRFASEASFHALTLNQSQIEAPQKDNLDFAVDLSLLYHSAAFRQWYKTKYAEEEKSYEKFLIQQERNSPSLCRRHFFRRQESKQDSTLNSLINGL